MLYMKKTILSILLLAACLMCARAETIILRTGARVRGTIVFQNEEVVVVRDESGARFQYPRAEVQDIIGDEAASMEDKEQPAKVQEMAVAKKATVLFELAGGVACLPSDTVGGAFSVDMLVGSHKINGKRIFVGAGVGYHGLFVGGEKYSFLPIQSALRMPLTDERHAPLFGVTLGYGVALSREYKGGIYAGLDFGYYYALNDRIALSLLLFAHFQQATISVTQAVENDIFVHTTGRNFVSSGLKVAVSL